MKGKLKLDLGQRISLIFTFILLLLLLITSSVIYRYFHIKTEKSLTESLGLVIQKNAQSVDEIFQHVDTSVSIINSDQSGLPLLLNQYDGDLYAGVSAFHKIQEQLSSYMMIAMEAVTSHYSIYLFVDDSMSLSKILSKANVNGLFLGNANGEASVFRDENVCKQEWFVKTKEKSEPYWFKKDGDDNNIYYSYHLQQIVNNGSIVFTRSMGVILIKMNVSWIQSSIDMSKLTKGTSILLLDANDKVIYSSNSKANEESLAKLINRDVSGVPAGMQNVEFLGKENLMQVEVLKSGLTLITLVPVYDISKMSFDVMSIIFGIAAAAVLIGASMVVVVSKIIVRPIKRLSDHMLDNKDLLRISVEDVTDDEVSILYHNFNNLMEQVQKLLQDVYEMAQKQLATELMTLQAQINPHFMYNTLDSVCCIALLRKEDDIADALSSLASMLRYNIKDPDSMVTLEQELKIIDNYIKIQQLRCGDKLTIDYDLDIDIGAVLIPKMVIQPLVENCIMHGTNPDDGMVELVLSCQEDGENLIFTVEDNGRGLDVIQINEYLNGSLDLRCSSGGFGIRNIQQRIHAIFGKEYGLHYTQTNKGGALATVRIPLINK